MWKFYFFILILQFILIFLYLFFLFLRFAPISDPSRTRSRLLSARSASRGTSATPKPTTNQTNQTNQINSNGESDNDPILPQDDIYEDTGDDIEDIIADPGLETSFSVKVMKNGVEVLHLY